MKDLKRHTVPELIKEIESMDFECEAGPLYASMAWWELKRRLIGYKAQVSSNAPPLLDMVQMVYRFNQEVIGLEIPEVPGRLSVMRKDHAIQHLEEEVEEFVSAGTLEDEADALLDLVYVALGRLVEMGLAPKPLFEEVHRANMRRVRGENSSRPDSAPYDAVKPEGWKPPNLAKYLYVTSKDLDMAMWYKGQTGPDPWHATLDEEDSQQTTEEHEDFQPPNLNKHIPRAKLEATVDELRSTAKELDENCKGAFDDLRAVARLKAALGTHSAPWETDKHPLEINRIFVNGWHTKRPKVLVLGYARHGKDTVAEILRDEYGLRFTSSSLFCAAEVVLPYLRQHHPEIANAYDVNCKDCEGQAQACFEDRANHRALWYKAIHSFNQPDASALSKAIFKEHDVYCGLRSRAEFNAANNAGIFDVSVWVDRSEHQPPEDRESCTVGPWMAQFEVDNNGSLDDLRFNVKQLFDNLMAKET